MPLVSSSPTSSPSLGESFLSLVLSDPTKVLTLVNALGQRLASIFPPIGMYEVLEQNIRLELQDPLGQQATYFKREAVRFLQNNVIAFQDQAWGDGDIFADYQCSPGIPVDRYREGHRYSILISLRKTMNRGEVQEFHIQRRILKGFTKPTEDLQAEINHRTHYLNLSVIFPRERLPKRCWLIEQNTRRTHAIPSEQFTYLPDKRLQVMWLTEKPHLFETYILMWEW